MKSRHTRLSFLIVVLALTAQLSFITPTVRANNTNTSTTMQEDMGRQDDRGSRSSWRCRRRCNAAYRQCVGTNRNSMACRRRLRNCLRRCWR
jgi:hypothetical protein